MAICIYQKPDGTRCDRPVSKKGLYCPEHQSATLMAGSGWACEAEPNLEIDDFKPGKLAERGLEERDLSKGTKGRA